MTPDPERMADFLAPAADWAYLAVLLALNRLGRDDPADRASLLAAIADLCEAGAARERVRAKRRRRDGTADGLDY